MKKVILAVTIVLTVLTIQACDDNGGGTQRVALNCSDVLTAALTRSGSADARRIIATNGVTNCSNTAVTVEGPESLDLNGFTVSCDGSAGSIGILLTGQGATVKNGIVENCEAGVVAQDQGGHTIRDMTAQNNIGDRDVQLAGGFVINSDNNTIRNVKASGNDPVGLQLIGDNNEVRDSDVSDNDHTGLVIFGNFNEVSDTDANDNSNTNVGIVSVVQNELTEDGTNNIISGVTANGNKLNNGIYVGGDFNTVSGSEADLNEVSGIVVGAESEGNTIENNMAFDNNQSVNSGDVDRGGTDLEQVNAVDCDNAWEDNEFGTSNSDCIQ